METPDGRKVDTHCWLCHKINENREYSAFCVQCPRVFHFHCLGPINRFSEEGLCPECRISSLDGTALKESLTPEKLAKLLQYALNVMLKFAPELKNFKYSEKQSQELFFPLDLAELLQKIKEKHYRNTAAFLADVKWILHNVQILPVGYNLSRNVKKAVRECMCELLDIEACPDCYEHIYSYEENWFSKICTVKHALVWAKIKGYPFWPAKVLKVIDGVAHIRFFGTHEKAKTKVPSNYCYWLSKESPNRKVPQSALFTPALEELEIYIKRICAEFGPIVYYPLGTIYDPASENICTKQVAIKRELKSEEELKPKKQKTISSALKTKDAGIVLKKPSEESGAVVQGVNGTAPAASTKSIMPKKTETVRSLFQDSKNPSLSSKETINPDVNDKSVSEVNSASAGKSLHKDATKHVGSSTRTQVTSERHSPKRNGGKNAPGEQTKRIRPTRPEIITYSECLISFASPDSVNAGSAIASQSVTCPGNSNVEISESPPASSETLSQHVNMSEDKGSDNAGAVIPEEHDSFITSFSGANQVVAFPDTNSEEPASSSRSEVLSPDTMLYYEDDQENQNEFSYDYATTSSGIQSDENAGPSQRWRYPPFCVLVPANSNEHVEPIIRQFNPDPLAQDAVYDNPQDDQHECTYPLPEELRVEKYHEKAMPLFRGLVEEMWHDVINSRNMQQVIASLQKENEELKAKLKKAEEIAKNTGEAIEVIRQKYEREKEEAIKEAKKKQWCQRCGKEAMFYCCGNNSCCNHPCQKSHWLNPTNPAGLQAENPPSPDSSDFQDIRSKQPLKQSRGGHAGVIISSGGGQILPSHQYATYHIPFPQTSIGASNSMRSASPSSVAQPSGNQTSLVTGISQMVPSCRPSTNLHNYSRPPVYPQPSEVNVTANTASNSVQQPRGHTTTGVVAGNSQMPPSCRQSSNLQNSSCPPVYPQALEVNGTANTTSMQYLHRDDILSLSEIWSRHHN